MSLSHFLSEYGYLAVFIGSVLEGETILLLSGIASHLGYMSLSLTVLCAAAGGTCGDQFFFFVGRRYGASVLVRFPRLAPHVGKVAALIEKHDTGLIVGVRFMYGLRIAGPLAIGMSTVPTMRFIGFNLLGAMIWATVIVGLGYLFGHTLQWLMDDLRKYEEIVLIAAVVGVLVIGLIRLWRVHRPR